MVRTRIAPSPTGFAHIGTIYQVLFDFAFARKNKGKFIVRIEDTDRARFVEGAEKVIFDALDWFCIASDEDAIKGGPYGPYRSSERLDVYQKYAKELIEKQHAYYCFCTKERLDQMRSEQQKNKQLTKYDKHCLSLDAKQVQENLDSGQSFVIRLNVPYDQKIIVHDEIVGDVAFDTNTIDDQVLIKSDGFPTYHLAVVVDDYLMKISHVFRGTEWLPSTPKHVLLYKFLGWEESIPQFIHLPLILNTDGKGKLSKRQAAAAVGYYKEEGYLPEAILNYLSNIVWNHPEGKEMYPLEEFIQLFAIKDLTSKGAKFDLTKLKWVNGLYIRAMSVEKLAKSLITFFPQYEILGKETFHKIVALAQSRIETLKDFDALGKHFIEEPVAAVDDPQREIADDLVLRLQTLDEWNTDKILEILKEILLTHTIKMGVLYTILTGQSRGLPLPETLVILEKERVIKRLENSA